MRVMALLLLAACGAPAPGPSPTDRSGSYRREYVTTLTVMPPNDSVIIGVTCQPHEQIGDAGCSIDRGGTLLENMVFDFGWTCAGNSTRDGVVMRVWITCAP